MTSFTTSDGTERTTKKNMSWLVRRMKCEDGVKKEERHRKIR